MKTNKSTNVTQPENWMKKFAVIKAKYSSVMYDGKRCRIGDFIVMFPRCNFEGVGASGKKSFSNTYVKLNDLCKFPEFAWVRSEIIKKYHINPDTYGKLVTTWRH